MSAAPDFEPPSWEEELASRFYADEPDAPGPDEELHVDATQFERLLDAGFELFPLKQWDAVDDHKKPAGKSPLRRGWRRNPALTLEKLQRLAAKGHGAGFRIPNTVVIPDWDRKNDPDGLSLRRFLRDHSDLKPTAISGDGGFHFYLQVPAGTLVRAKLDCYPGIDFKAHGGYVVVPGSLHPNGNHYRWADEAAIDFGLAEPRPIELQEMPASLLEMLRRPEPKAKSGEPQMSLERAVACLRQLEPGDFRNYQDWTRLAMAFHAATGASNEAREIFVEWSTSDPPYADHAERIRGHWDSYNVDGGRGAGTLIHLVKEASGKVPPADATDPVEDFEDEIEGDESPKMSPRRLTAVGNAERFAAQHGGKILWLAQEGRWVIWNGLHWDQDAKEIALKLAQETATSIYAEAARAAAHHRVALGKWAIKSESAGEIKAMIELAKPKLAARVEDFDADPWLLNTRSGIVDLRAMELRQPDPAARMRCITAARFDPAARCKVFQEIVERALPDDEIRMMAQRSLGYAILGVQQHKAAFVPFGEKDSAKSTLVWLIYETLGTYAKTAAIETFSSKRHAASASPDLAHLVGARLVVINEVPDGGTLRSDLFKAWTGGKDMVNCRALYKGQIEFLPQGTLFFVGNSRPNFDAADDAAWRRVIPIPFGESIPEDEQQPDIAERVNLDAVLAWGLEGVRDLLMRGGIDPPESVLAVREEYRAEANVLLGFVRERLLPREGAKLHKEEVWRQIRVWLDREQGIPRSQQRTDPGLGRLLGALGVMAGGRGNGFYVDWEWADGDEL